MTIVIYHVKMRVSKQQAQANRERVLDCAARMFRKGGYAEVGIDAVMQAAGLTHGGFYGQFAGKGELIAQASARALDELWERWRDKSWTELLDLYLSPAHMAHPERGCVLAALGGELARQPAEVREMCRDRLERLLLWMGQGDRELGSYRCASMVGAMVLARTLEDPGVLAAARRRLVDGERSVRGE